MLHLHDLAKEGSHQKKLSLTERLPNFLASPCTLDVTYQVETGDKYYLLKLNVLGDLQLVCQRCMHEFEFPYENETTVAVCFNEQRAEQLLEQYECIVSSNGEVNLEDIVIDELHLYAPVFHPRLEDCDNEVNQMLTEKNEGY